MSHIKHCAQCKKYLGVMSEQDFYDRSKIMNRQIREELAKIKIPTRVGYEVGGAKEGVVEAWVMMPPSVINQIQEVFQEVIDEVHSPHRIPVDASPLLDEAGNDPKGS